MTWWLITTRAQSCLQNPEERAAQPKDMPQYGAYSNLLKYIEGKIIPPGAVLPNYILVILTEIKRPIFSCGVSYTNPTLWVIRKRLFQKAELWVHYRLVKRRIQKQPTDSTTVKTWLAVKQLTWQKATL